MANKTFQGRIVQKHDTKANWEKATNFIPLKGEIIVYDDLKKIRSDEFMKVLKEETKQENEKSSSEDSFDNFIPQAKSNGPVS